MRPRLAAALLVLAATGCAEDSVAPPAGRQVEIVLVDSAFQPALVVVPTGTAVTVSLRNDGRAPHTFTTAGVDETLQPGQRATATLTVSADPLAFYCRFHRGGGMEGRFASSSAAPAPPASPGGSATEDRY